MSSAQQAVSSPIASHVDVVVQLPDSTSGTFRVRQITPWDYSADNGRVGEAFGRMFNRLLRGGQIGDLSTVSVGDALICVAPTAEPLDDNARRHGVLGVHDFASTRRLAFAFIRINLLDERRIDEMGKLVEEFSKLLTDYANRSGSMLIKSSTSPTNSSVSATPPSSPTASPSSV